MSLRDRILAKEESDLPFYPRGHYRSKLPPPSTIHKWDMLQHCISTYRRFNEAFQLPPIYWVAKMLDKMMKEHDDIEDIASRYRVTLDVLKDSDDYLTVHYDINIKKYVFLLSNFAFYDITNDQKIELVKEIEAGVIRANSLFKQNPSKEDYISYLSKPQEIEAFAKMFAFEIKQFQQDNDESVKAIQNGDIRGMMPANREAFKTYSELDVYERLVEEMTKYIMEKKEDGYNTRHV